MRRSLLALIVTVTTLVAASGVALAMVRDGGPGDDTLIGSSDGDNMEGKGGDDTLRGLAGGDWLIGGGDNDRLLGQADGDELWGGLEVSTRFIQNSSR